MKTFDDLVRSIRNALNISNRKFDITVEDMGSHFGISLVIGMTLKDGRKIGQHGTGMNCYQALCQVLQKVINQISSLKQDKEITVGEWETLSALETNLRNCLPNE